MKIRHKRTGKIYEVMRGTRYPSFYEEVKEAPKIPKTTEVEKKSVSKTVENREKSPVFTDSGKNVKTEKKKAKRGVTKDVETKQD